MDLDTRVARTAYLVRMMRLARWMSFNLSDDYERRVVGRMVLVFAPMYIESAFSLLKSRKGFGDADREHLRGEVRHLRDDFDGFYSGIRDDLAAHRDALPLDVAIEAWNEIDSDTLDWFCSAVDTNMEGIARKHAFILGSVTDFDDMGDVENAKKLATPGDDASALRFSTDSLSMTRGHIGIVLTHPVQQSASVLTSILQSLKICERLNKLLEGNLASHLLLKSMFIVDTVNLIDGIYGVPVGASPRRSSSFVSILDDGDFGGASLLKSALHDIDLEAVRAIRKVRNRACAHLDPSLSVRGIYDLILDVDDSLLLERVLNPAVTALEDSCAQDITTRWLLIDEVSLFGISAASTPGVRAFDRTTES